MSAPARRDSNGDIIVNGHYDATPEDPGQNAIQRLMNVGAERQTGLGIGNYFRELSALAQADRTVRAYRKAAEAMEAFAELKLIPHRTALEVERLNVSILQARKEAAILAQDLEEMEPNSPEKWARARAQARLDEAGQNDVRMTVERQRARDFVRHARFKKAYARKLTRMKLSDDEIQAELAESDRIFREQFRTNNRGDR